MHRVMICSLSSRTFPKYDVMWCVQSITSLVLIQTSLVMFGWEKRVFGLDYGLHISLLQVLAHCSGREGLMDNINECLGHLNSIVYLSRWDEMRWVAWHMLAGESLEGWSPAAFWRSEHSLEWSLDMVDTWSPVEVATEWADWPASSIERTVCFWVGQMNLMIWLGIKKCVNYF